MRNKQTHKLKTVDVYFDAIADGRKTFEVRRNDRGFQTGDILELERIGGADSFLPGRYTGETLVRQVTYILQGEQFGIAPGHCVMGLAVVDKGKDDSHAE